MCAAVAQSRGQITTAARWFRQSLAGGLGWAFTLLNDLPGALGMAGDAIPARDALGQMTTGWHPGLVSLKPEVLLAGARPSSTATDPHIGASSPPASSFSSTGEGRGLQGVHGW